MAEVKASCGACGAAVPWEWTGVLYAVRRCTGRSGGAPVRSVRNMNPAGATTCATAGRAFPAQRPAAKPAPKNSPRGKAEAGAVRPAFTRRKIRALQVISFVAVVSLVAVLLYVELSGIVRRSARQRWRRRLRHPCPASASTGARSRPAGSGCRGESTNRQALLQLANAQHDRPVPQSRGDLQEVSSRVPQGPGRTDRHGGVLLRAGDGGHGEHGRYFALAIQEMEAAFRGSPSHQPSAFNLGVVHLQKGDLENSNRWFAKLPS